MAETNLCCGARKRTSAFIAGGSALAISLGLILLVSILLITSYRETRVSDAGRGLGSMYAASLVVFACWSLLTFILLGGIRIENRRALIVWLLFSTLLPLVLVCDLAYLVATGHTSSSEIAYLVVLGVAVIFSAYIAAVIYQYSVEVQHRDKNPSLRADDYAAHKMFDPSFGLPHVLTAPSNLGAAASESSVFRSQRVATEGMSYSRADQWGGQTAHLSATDDAAGGKKSSRPGSRANSRENLSEREGGSTYYKYQYSAERPSDRLRSASQGSLSGSKHVLSQPTSGGVDSTV